MKFTEYYDCFTENELAAGAELYFSGDLQEIETRCAVRVRSPIVVSREEIEVTPSIDVAGDGK